MRQPRKRKKKLKQEWPFQNGKKERVMDIRVLVKPSLIDTLLANEAVFLPKETKFVKERLDPGHGMRSDDRLFMSRFHCLVDETGIGGDGPSDQDYARMREIMERRNVETTNFDNHGK